MMSIMYFKRVAHNDKQDVAGLSLWLVYLGGSDRDLF